MISKSECLRIGVIKKLEENARERAQLLKLIGVKEGRNTRQKGLDILQALTEGPTDAQPKRKVHHRGKHWTQRPENRAKLLAMNKKSAHTRKMATQ